MNQLDLFYELQRYDSITNSQKVCAAVALCILQKINRETIIAGGAPRDWLFDRHAKDIDIYIQSDKGESNWEFEKVISNALASRVVDITTTSDYLANLDNGVLGVFDIKDCYMPIQVIRGDRPPLTMLDTFHCSLSRAYARLASDNKLVVQGNWEFQLSREYKMNMIKKKFDPKYIAKIREKFPDFTEVYEQ